MRNFLFAIQHFPRAYKRGFPLNASSSLKQLLPKPLHSSIIKHLSVLKVWVAINIWFMLKVFLSCWWCDITPSHTYFIYHAEMEPLPLKPILGKSSSVVIWLCTVTCGSLRGGLNRRSLCGHVSRYNEEPIDGRYAIMSSNFWILENVALQISNGSLKV